MPTPSGDTDPLPIRGQTPDGANRATPSQAETHIFAHVTGCPDAETLASPTRPTSGLAGPTSGPPAIHAFDRVGQYRIVRLIAAGGMGVVYEAIQDRPQRTVALKIIRPGLTDVAALRRFENESQVLARLGHACIAQVYEAGVHIPPGGDAALAVPYFAMEFVPGARSITQYAKERNLDVRDKLMLFSRVCDAVDHAHSQRVIHRDLKPSNILVSVDEARAGEGGSRVIAATPKVIDFGIARATDASGMTMHTSPFAAVGTPEYMSPEQCGGAFAGPVDERSDVYALGVVLFELLTGELPYPVRGLETTRVPFVISTARPARASRIERTISTDLERVIQACLRKEPAQRYPSAGAVRDDLERIVAGEPIGPDPSGRARRVYYGFRRFAAHHTFGSLACACLVAIGIVMMLDRLSVLERTGLDWRFNNFILTRLAEPSLGARLRDVRIIALTESTDVAALAEEAGINGVSDSFIPSLRRLHARLLDRLGESGCTAVAFDIHFGPSTDFDADFAIAAKRLRTENGVDVVVETPRWDLDPRGMPDISEQIRQATRWGVATGSFHTEHLWRQPFMAHLRGEPAIPSFDLSILSAFRGPTARPEYVLRDDELEVQYFAGDDPDRGQQPVRPADAIPLTRVAQYNVAETPRAEHRGLTPQHELADVLVPLPGAEYFTGGTIEYSDVLHATGEKLRDLFSGRIVLVANLRPGVDVVESDGGRSIRGVWAHAAVIQTVLLNRVVRFPTDVQAFTVLAIMAIAGVAVGARLARRSFLLVLTICAILTVILLVSVGTYSGLGLIWHPILPATTLLIGAPLGLGIARLCPDRSRRA